MKEHAILYGILWSLFSNGFSVLYLNRRNILHVLIFIELHLMEKDPTTLTISKAGDRELAHANEHT